MNVTQKPQSKRILAIDMVTRRKGEMTSMESQGDRTNIEFDIPSRGIMGLRTNVLTASQGEIREGLPVFGTCAGLILLAKQENEIGRAHV